MHDNCHLGLFNQINDLHDILAFFFFGKPYYARKLSNSNNHCTQAMSQCNGSTGTNCYLDNINSLLQSRKQPSHIHNNMRKPLIANICYLFTRKKSAPSHKVNCLNNLLQAVVEKRDCERF